MNSSQTGQELRQRGLAIAGGGWLLQLIAVGIASASTSFGAIAFLPLLATAGFCLLSFTQGKDKTGTANTAAVITLLVGAAAAFAASSGSPVLFALVGAVIIYFGNEQLAAGTRS